MRSGLPHPLRAVSMPTTPAPITQKHVLLRLQAAAGAAGLFKGGHLLLRQLPSRVQDSHLLPQRLLLLLVDSIQINFWGPRGLNLRWRHHQSTNLRQLPSPPAHIISGTIQHARDVPEGAVPSLLAHQLFTLLNAVVEAGLIGFLK